ncbi:MAG: ScpA family protein [Patescibacteria group bacterium]
MRDVKVATFNGPLDLLLQLIESEELDISQVSLANVTDQYIASLQAMDELPIDELADFLVVAAKLLLIKSRLLVPDAAAEDDSGLELEHQLKMYQAFVAAAKHVAKLYNRHRVLYPREGYAAMEPIFNPPEHLKIDHLREIFSDVLKELEPITRLPQTVIVRTINIRHKIEQITQRLLAEKTMSFHQLLRQSNNKTEVIITFLAVLEMVKLRTAAVAQETLYADLNITALDPESEILQPIVIS